MQILSEHGYENGEHEGLSFIEGRLKNSYKWYLPHVGWNSLETKSKNKILKDISDNTDFYFTHSYYFKLTNSSNEVAFTNYGIDFPDYK